MPVLFYARVRLLQKSFWPARETICAMVTLQGQGSRPFAFLLCFGDCMQTRMQVPRFDNNLANRNSKAILQDWEIYNR